MIATVTGWFEKHRSLAVSLVSAGMGVAPMTISPFAGWLITTYDWRDRATLHRDRSPGYCWCRSPSWCGGRQRRWRELARHRTPAPVILA